MDQLKQRLKAAFIHFGLSVAVAAMAASLVFALWYPYPYRQISGGRELFIILASVDVILGPLLTFAIFNRSKPWPILRRDLTVVGLLQATGLCYGLWTVFVARPVHLVFEIDRFRVVHAIDVESEMLSKAQQGIGTMPWVGPTMLAVRPFKNEKERMEVTLAALNGAVISFRPDLWQKYDDSRADVLRAAKPVAELKRRFPAQSALIDGELGKTGPATDNLLYLPLVGRKSFWTAILDPNTAQVVGYLPLDSF